MEEIRSIASLSSQIIKLYLQNTKKILVVVIGGCSRTGKTTLAKELSNTFNKSNCNSLILHIDSWLISVEHRKSNSKVLERYNTTAICKSAFKLLKGEQVIPPEYDPVTRMSRHVVTDDTPLQLNSGILIIEGVISLSLKELVRIADLKIYTKIPDIRRIKRLIEFYSIVKKVPRSEYKKIITSREFEEIPFIKETSRNADIIYYN